MQTSACKNSFLTLVSLRQLVLVQHFWPNVGDGSWLLEVNGASHNTFLRASWLVEKALDLLCKRGPTSHEASITVCHSMMYSTQNLPCSFAHLCRVPAQLHSLPQSVLQRNEACPNISCRCQLVAEHKKNQNMWCFAWLDARLTHLCAGYNWFDHASNDSMDGQRVAGCTDGYSGTFIAQSHDISTCSDR